jgi:copper chaperone NosL
MMRYLRERLPAIERGLILAAALVLLPVFFMPVLPVWTMRMKAPQYPEGLTLTIYTNDIRGDVQKINTLNHYVGMKAIAASDFKEFTYMPQALSLFGLGALLAALLGRRWIAVLGWLGFTAFAVVMFLQFGGWLYRYGHELDPRAAIKLDVFMPPLIGFKQMANFKVWSYPAVGTFLLGVAWLLGPAIAWFDWRRWRAERAAEAVRAAATASGSTLGDATGSGDAR